MNTSSWETAGDAAAERPARNRRRKLDQLVSADEPAGPERWPQVHPVRRSAARGIEAEHRPEDLLLGAPLRCRLRGDELLGGGPTHVAALVQPVESESESSG